MKQLDDTNSTDNQPQGIPEHTNPNPQTKQQQLLRGTTDIQNENSPSKPVLRGSTDFQNENSPSKSLFRGSADLQTPNSPSKPLFRGSANSNENSKHQLLRGTTELQNLGLEEAQTKGKKFFHLGKCQICHSEAHDIYLFLSCIQNVDKTDQKWHKFSKQKKILQVCNPTQNIVTVQQNLNTEVASSEDILQMIKVAWDGSVNKKKKKRIDLSKPSKHNRRLLTHQTKKNRRI